LHSIPRLLGQSYQWRALLFARNHPRNKITSRCQRKDHYKSPSPPPLSYGIAVPTPSHPQNPVIVSYLLQPHLLSPTPLRLTSFLRLRNQRIRSSILARLTIGWAGTIQLIKHSHLHPTCSSRNQSSKLCPRLSIPCHLVTPLRTQPYLEAENQWERNRYFRRRDQ
jgi:hypothetical protein